MSNYEWTSELSVGNLVLDQHHQNLIKLFDVADEILTQMKPSTQTSKIISELTTYSIFHFSEEERLMRASGYKNLEEHILEHKDFADKIQEFRDNLCNKPENLNEQIFLFLYNWLITHIKHSDKKYEGALKAFNSPK